MQAPDVLYRYNLTLFSDDAVVGRRFHRTEQVHLLFDYLNSNAGPAELRGAWLAADAFTSSDNDSHLVVD